MAVTSKELRSPRAHRRTIWAAFRRLNHIVHVVMLTLAILASYVLVSTVVAWGRVWLDDLHYGRPRTTHLRGFVGHAEERGQPTHFIAVNLQRQVVVLELPGGDPGKVRSLPGPYLFGADEDLTPVSIALNDVDRDGYNDLLINVRDEQVVYLNKDGTFRLPSPEEQLDLVLEQQ